MYTLHASIERVITFVKAHIDDILIWAFIGTMAWPDIRENISKDDLIPLAGLFGALLVLIAFELAAFQLAFKVF